MITLNLIRQAAEVLHGVVRQTDMIQSRGLATGTELLLKTENLQVTGSFKVRGAYFRMSTMTEEERRRGVVACSAGNHAQGVALSAQQSGTPATIFIPSVAPIYKIEATKSMGADIRIVDGVYDDAYTAARAFEAETGAVFIHPFDDPRVIAGQGTIGLEILEQAAGLDAVILPIGGGGLIAGVAFAIKSLNPSCKVYGVQAAGAAGMHDSFAAKEYLTSKRVSTFADGIAVKAPGTLTYDLCSQYVDDIVTVTDDEIATSILALMEQEKLVAEGAGAVAVAAAMFGKLPIEGKRVCAVVSGGNIDVNILARVISRGQLATGRIAELTLELLDKPGQLFEVSAIIAKMGANVTKVVHNHGGENTDITGCYLHLTLETRNKEHIEQVVAQLRAEGYKVTQ